MKKTIMTFLTACFAIVGQAQDEFRVTINKTVVLDASNVISLKQADLSAPPTDPDFSLKDDEFVTRIVSSMEYWDGFYSGHQTTLYISPDPKSSADSVLVAEGENNIYYFNKIGDKWLIRNFTIKGSNISLRHVACGQTSKEVFKLLKKKIKKPVGDGHVWISNKKGNGHIVLTFSKDKLVSMRY